MRILPIFCFLSSIIFTSHALAQEAEIAVSIKPLHSLVAGVMEGTGTPALIVSGNESLHDFQLRPSQMSQLQKARVVFYVDDAFETFLHNAFETLPASVHRSALAQKSGLTILSHRKGGAWEIHEYHAHEHEEHHEHDHDEHAHDHSHEDLHVWLDAGNAQKMVRAIASELGFIYPQHKAIYEKNAQAMVARIAALDTEIKKQLAGVKDKPFIVFHDAYQYFERRYGLSGAGSITFEPGESPSPSRLTQVREKLKQTGAACVFREPIFSDKLVLSVTEGSNARTGTLDPEGAALEAGKDLYFILMRNLAESIRNCLAP